MTEDKRLFITNLAFRDCARYAHAFGGNSQHSLANVVDGEQGVALTRDVDRGFPNRRLGTVRYQSIDLFFELSYCQPTDSDMLWTTMGNAMYVRYIICDL